MNKNKITFLLGAGASIPFISCQGKYLTSEYLTDALFDRQKWEDILSKFNNYKLERYNSKSYLDNIDIDDILFVISKIKYLLQKNVQFKNVNFEYIIHLLDKVVHYLSSHTPNEYGNIDDILIDFWQQTDSQLKQYAFRNSNNDGWRYVPFLARELLATAIICLWNNNNPVIKNGIEINQKFFETLLHQFKSANIYSLNYDPLLYESLKTINKFFTGFNGNNIFQSNTFYKAVNIIAFVHGHIAFEPSNNQMKFNDDYFVAQENRMRDIFNITTNSTQYWNIGMKGVHYNTYLITGLDKIDGFSLNPFASYIHRFGKDIIESEYIVLAGASLNDYHLNSFLTNAIFISDKKILFVAKSDVKTIKGYFSSGGENIVFKLWTLFKDTITVSQTSEADPLKNHLDNLYESLDYKGYGKLTNHIVLYIKGTEKFYKEADIIELWKNKSVT